MDLFSVYMFEHFDPYRLCEKEVSTRYFHKVLNYLVSYSAFVVNTVSIPLSAYKHYANSHQWRHQNPSSMVLLQILYVFDNKPVSHE